MSRSCAGGYEGRLNRRFVNNYQPMDFLNGEPNHSTQALMHVASVARSETHYLVLKPKNNALAKKQDETNASHMVSLDGIVQIAEKHFGHSRAHGVSTSRRRLNGAQRQWQ